MTTTERLTAMPVRIAREAMSDKLTRRALIATAAVFAAFVLLALSGMTLAMLVLAGASTWAAVSYFENESHVDLRVPIEKAWEASLDAVGENGFLFGEPSWFGATDGRIKAGGATLLVERHPGDVTRVRVRVGILDTADNRRRADLVVESVRRLANRRPITLE